MTTSPVTKEELFKHRTATLAHVNEVRERIWKLIEELDKRGQEHDASKFVAPEEEIYARNLHWLAKTEYGTEEYKRVMELSKPAIEHHYAANRHHPEHWPNGINDMDLVDIVELLCDWMAATKRNKNGNIHRSIALNTARYGLSSQLVDILSNTVNRYFNTAHQSV